MSPEQVAEQEGINLERGQENLAKILAQPTVKQQLNASLALAPKPTERKRRSDAGIPKKPSAAATLTIQFDLSETPGREMFAKTLKFWAENGEMEAIKQIAEQFAKRVDALSRAK